LLRGSGVIKHRDSRITLLMVRDGHLIRFELRGRIMRRRQLGFVAEVLEYRFVPTSLVAIQHPVALAPVEPPRLNQIHHVFGTVQGTYSSPGFFGIDAGVTNTFQGRGNFPLLGQVRFQGTLQGPGNIAFGQANGEITLSNSQGSLTLELVGPIQKSFASLPQDFQFSVVSGTGAFTSMQMTGTIHLVENSKNQTFSASFLSVKIIDTAALNGPGAGNFTSNSATYQLTEGTASLEFMGQVNVTGTIQGIGFAMTGRATGKLTLTNSQGNVTLSLTSPVQHGFVPLPTQFQFKVTGATGAYKGLNKSGSIDLTFTPTLWASTINPVHYLPVVPFFAGGFTIAIHA
jgi:hypothetical protein